VILAAMLPGVIEDSQGIKIAPDYILEANE
jgi:hypothetical protein